MSDVAQRFSAANLLIVAPNWLGDAVMALPAIDDVRRALPEARLTVAARRSLADVFRLTPQVNAVLALQTDGRWWRRAAFRADVETMRAAQFDAALLLPNSFQSAWLVAQAGISERWGYASDFRARLLTRRVPRAVLATKGGGHQTDYYQRLTAALGMASIPQPPAIAVSDATRAAARELLAQHGHAAGRPVVVCAPGAAYGSAKQWIPSHVATLIMKVMHQRDVSCVLVGSKADAAAVAAITRGLPAVTKGRVIDLAGLTSIEMLAGVLAEADVCVSNDSGAMHLAAAAGATVVAIFGPTDPRATAPRPRPGRRVEVVTHDVWCRPCMLRECPIDHRCMTGITPERVFGIVSDIIA